MLQQTHNFRCGQERRRCADDREHGLEERLQRTPGQYQPNFQFVTVSVDMELHVSPPAYEQAHGRLTYLEVGRSGRWQPAIVRGWIGALRRCHPAKHEARYQ